MATIKFKRGATDTTGTLASGEPALNTASKKLWVGYDDTNKVWVGAEIEATMASTTSALKLVTQKGIVDYIAGLGYGSGSGDMLLGSVQTVTGVKTFNSGTLKHAGSTSGTTILNASAVAGTTTLVLPAADDTLVGKATTDTLTNKTIAAGSNTITGLTNSNLSGTAGISNANLANSTVVIGSTTVTLGAAATTTIAGLTSVSSTGFTGALTGNASTATALATTRAIYGNNFDGSAALTAAIAGTYGGTGVNNGANTITVAGNVSYAGAYTQTFTATGNTSVTLPTTGTLATLSGTETLANKTLTTPNIGAATGTSLVLSGDLTVNGTTTTINSSTLTVDDKNIELGSVGAGIVSTTGTIGTVSGSGPYTATITSMSSTTGLIPGQTITATNGTGGFGSGTMTVSTIASSTSITVSSTLTFTAGTVTNITSVAANDATADGGGITLKGTTDKTIIWDSTNSNWTLSENVNIPTGKVFKINNTSVLSATTLGSAVVSSSLTSVGTIATGTWQGTAIADTYISSAATWNTASTDRLKWDGGATGLTAATGRTSLGLVIGTNVQAWNTTLDAVAGGTYIGSTSTTTVGTVTTGTIDGGTY